MPAYATEYVLACIKYPTDPDDRTEAVRAFSMDTLNKKMLLNVETRGSPAGVTIVDPTTNVDLGKVFTTYNNWPILRSSMVGSVGVVIV